MNAQEDIIKETYDYRSLRVQLLFDKKAEICAMVLTGSMDTLPVLEFREVMKDKLLLKRYDFIIDLSRVTYISSTGLGFLMFLAGRKKDTVFLSSPRKNIAKPLKVLGIHPMFKFYDTVEDLKEKLIVVDQITTLLMDGRTSEKDILYHDRWQKILRDHLAYVEIADEIEKLQPHILQADNNDSITLPSDVKYTCILYRFMARIFRDIARFDKTEMDDADIEMIAKELMDNAVRHGYDNNKEGVVEANYKMNTLRLEINVIDYGKGFASSLDDTFPATGLKLVEKFFDKLDISEAPKKKVKGFVVGKGTMVTMVKNLLPGS